MKVSVIMASYLGAIQGRERPNMDKKLVRAVKSFLNQSHPDKELVIVSDGCQATNDIIESNFGGNPEIKLLKSQKLEPYSGGIRQQGLSVATGDIICYLDNDDVIAREHIKTIHDNFDFDNLDLVYYDDYLVLDQSFKTLQVRTVDPRWASIGTSSHAHVNFFKHKGRINKDVYWPTGYSHDFTWISSIIGANARFKKLDKTPQYLVAHYGNADF